MNGPDIGIYEPIYRPGQTLAQPEFRALRGDNERPHLRELQFYEKLYEDRVHLQHDLTGLFSPRFGEKTGLSAHDVIAFVEENSDGEVFTFNAVPRAPYYAYNIWMQGELAHPGIMSVGQNLLDACRIDVRLADVGRHGPDVWCFSNFWLGSRRFWEDYVGGLVQPLLTFVQQNPEHPSVLAAMEITYHDKPTPFLPFIVERLFNTFLSAHEAWRGKVRAYRLDPMTRLGSVIDFDLDVVSAMRDRVDRADREGVFPDDLIATMSLLSRLRMRQAMAHYAVHSHPNWGRPLDADALSRGAERLSRIPVPKLP